MSTSEFGGRLAVTWDLMMSFVLIGRGQAGYVLLEPKKYVPALKILG